MVGVRLFPARPARTDLSELSDHLGTKAAPLAFGLGEDTLAVGLRHALAVRRGRDWVVMPYHELARGGWDPASSTLWWQPVDGQRDEVVLSDPGRVPELFRERMTASVVADAVVAAGADSVRVVARRDLADPSSELMWSATPVTGKPGTDAMFRLLAAAIEQVKGDYAIA